VTGVGVTRDRLIRVATAALMRRGVHGSGVGDICTRAGVTKGVFTHHFPDGKEQLVLEVIDRNRADLTSVLRARTGRSPAALVRELFESYADRLRRNGTDFGCPVAAAVVDASEQWPRVREATRATFEEWSRQLPLDDGLGDLVIATLEGAILQARAQADADVVDRIGTALARLLAHDDPQRAAS